MSDFPQQSASGTGIAQAYGEGASATVHIGLKPEEVASLLQAAGAAQQARIDEIAAWLNVTQEAFRGFLRILKEDEVPLDQLPQKLELIAARYTGMLDRLAALDPEDAEAQGYIDKAREVLRHAASNSDYDRADELLSKAADAQSRTRQRIKEFAREANEALRRSTLSEASMVAESGELSLTRLDYFRAAERFRSAAELVSDYDASLRLHYLFRSALALQTHGDEKGDNAVLTQAIAVYREVLSGERVPLDWAMTQNNLGNALSMLGERESGSARLQEAVDAYRDALLERTRERVPLDWAMTQNNLGNALRMLGERESGSARLEEAVDAYRDALLEQTRERVPLDWAMTQNNLGIALQTLGERETGTARLEEAVGAYHAALLEYTRARVPLDWAMTQNNLATALQTLGERETGTARLEEAVGAYRAALLEYTRERVPLQWASAQNNLATALQTLGERESGAARLQEAVDAYRAALLERTRERVPLQWARTQNNLGTALSTMGKRESGTARLQEAVDAYRAALLERTRERVPLQWATTQNNLGIALSTMGERESGTESAIERWQEARAAIQMAWEVYRDAGMYQYDRSFERRLKAIDELIALRRSE